MVMCTEVKKPGEHIPPSNTVTGKATKHVAEVWQLVIQIPELPNPAEGG